METSNYSNSGKSVTPSPMAQQEEAYDREPPPSTPGLPDLDLDDIIAEVEDLDGTSDVMTPEVAAKVINSFAEKNNTSTTGAIVGITALVQAGGTNASKTKLKRKVNNVIFDIEDLRRIIKLHSSDGTVRKLAKTIRDQIGYIAEHNGWAGPLTKELKRLEPHLTMNVADEAYCNEIHSDNYDKYVPAKIREALQRREARLREANKVNNNSGGNKARRKGGKKKKGK